MTNANNGLLKEFLHKIEGIVRQVRCNAFLEKELTALMFRDRFLKWLKGLIDIELATLIERDQRGSGLKFCINKTLDSLLRRANQYTMIKPLSLRELKSL